MNRVLYIWQGDYPWEVRVEKVCLALVKAGCEVTVLSRWREGEPPEELHRGIRVVRVGQGRPRIWSVPVSINPAWRTAIGREIQAWRPNLLMAREIMLAEAAASAARSRGLPMLIDMAEHYPATMRAFKKYRRNLLTRYMVFNARIPDRIERRSVARADGVITVCDEQNKRLHEIYGCGEDRMAVVHNTPSLDAFPGVRLGPDLPARTFAYHGSMSDQRGLDLLVRGFALAAKQDPDIRLDLAGDGESRDDLIRLAGELGLSDRVRFPGRYRYEDLSRLYSETDIGLVIYPHDESIDFTIGNKIFDYMACGKPVIVSPAGPSRRVVEETGSGIVLDDGTPETISRGMMALRTSDPKPYSERGLDAARRKYNWGQDADVLLRFVEGFLR